MQTSFVDVIVPVKIPQLFTYRIPVELDGKVKVGMRLIVQFGQKKVTTVVAMRIHHSPPTAYEAKYVLDVLEETPTVHLLQLDFWQWMATYYLCCIGEVMQAALPSGLKISSQSRIQLHPEFRMEEAQEKLSPKELALIEALQKEASLSYPEAAELLNIKDIYHTLKYLVAKQAIILYEEVREQYTPKRVRRIRLSRQYASSEDTLEGLFQTLAAKPKQEEVLLKYLSLVPIYAQPGLNERGIDKSKLMHEGTPISDSSLATLIKNDIFEELEVVVSRLSEYDEQAEGLEMPNIALSKLQRQACDRVLASFDKHNTVLLHGITGSGKPASWEP